MSQRRMFSNRIANSAKFLQMPGESQLLYFHMILRADDDGVVESYPIMRLLGLSPDVFSVLVAKGFIQPLNEDQVVIIVDWKEHNVIRADRKVDSIYKDLILEVAPNIKLLEAKPRSDVEDNSNRVGGQSTDGISKVRLGKDSIGKDKLIHTMTPSQEAEEFFEGKQVYTDMLYSFAEGKVFSEVEKQFQAFCSYWTEPNKSGSKVRWQLESTFDVRRRLGTWMSRAVQFQKPLWVKK